MAIELLKVCADEETKEAEDEIAAEAAEAEDEAYAEQKVEARRPKPISVSPAVLEAVSIVNKREEEHEAEDFCFVCRDGGSLILCDEPSCNKVYHIKCAKLSQVPSGVWRCPWHSCVDCGYVLSLLSLLSLSLPPSLSLSLSSQGARKVLGQ